jgi:hypothetical protein
MVDYGLYQKGGIMLATMTSWERKGFEQGFEQGKIEERRSLAKPLEENRSQHAQRQLSPRANLSFDRVIDDLWSVVDHR